MERKLSQKQKISDVAKMLILLSCSMDCYASTQMNMEGDSSPTPSYKSVLADQENKENLPSVDTLICSGELRKAKWMCENLLRDPDTEQKDKALANRYLREIEDIQMEKNLNFDYGTFTNLTNRQRKGERNLEEDVRNLCCQIMASRSVTESATEKKKIAQMYLDKLILNIKPSAYRPYQRLLKPIQR